jgi:hypothetical protein
MEFKIQYNLHLCPKNEVIINLKRCAQDLYQEKTKFNESYQRKTKYGL